PPARVIRSARAHRSDPTRHRPAAAAPRAPRTGAPAGSTLVDAEREIFGTAIPCLPAASEPRNDRQRDAMPKRENSPAVEKRARNAMRKTRNIEKESTRGTASGRGSDTRKIRIFGKKCLRKSARTGERTGTGSTQRGGAGASKILNIASASARAQREGTSSPNTGSVGRITRNCWPFRTAAAGSAEKNPTSFASITATRPARCEVCSARYV